MTLLIIGIAAGLATYIGGSLALRFQNKIHLILGFSAGAVIAVALIDLLPEALELGGQYYETGAITAVAVFGFAAFMILDRIFMIGVKEEEGHGGHGHRGHLGAGSLTVHSFLDGVAIGLAFQVSAALGAIVAVAVLVHDFSDGVNTVNLSMVGTGKHHIARRWLTADALAPLLGIGSTLFFSVPEQYLALILALFSGFFLYIGASELLPESHHRHPRLFTSFMTVLGMLVMFAAIHFAGV
ncbi:MAG: ZIP family metal transporter [bacterium]